MVYGLGPSKPPLAFGVLLVPMLLLNSYRSVTIICLQLHEKIRICYTWWTTKEKVKAIFLGKKMNLKWIAKKKIIRFFFEKDVMGLKWIAIENKYCKKNRKKIWV
jgi:hypothetical protein